MIATVASFFAVGTGFLPLACAPGLPVPAGKCPSNNGFVVAFYIVLWNETVIFNSGLV